jgi:hypothetical protein
MYWSMNTRTQTGCNHQRSIGISRKRDRRAALESVKGLSVYSIDHEVGFVIRPLPSIPRISQDRFCGPVALAA